MDLDVRLAGRLGKALPGASSAEHQEKQAIVDSQPGTDEEKKGGKTEKTDTKDTTAPDVAAVEAVEAMKKALDAKVP